MDTPLPSDNEVRERLNYFTQQLRQAGILGDTVSDVGQAREPSLDPEGILGDGLAPMVRTVPQQDR